MCSIKWNKLLVQSLTNVMEKYESALLVRLQHFIHKLSPYQINSRQHAFEVVEADFVLFRNISEQNSY